MWRGLATILHANCKRNILANTAAAASSQPALVALAAAAMGRKFYAVRIGLSAQCEQKRSVVRVDDSVSFRKMV